MQVSYPVDKETAGRSAWTLLHHRAALYSDSPSEKEKQRMKDFIFESMNSIAKLCTHCKKHIHDYLKSNSLSSALEGKKALSKYLCEMHNNINERNGKDIVNCHLILNEKKEECKDCQHVVKKDTTDLKAAFEKFKDISTKIFHTLCDRYKVPYPIIKFHECPNNPLNSCTSMWVDPMTQNIMERPVVYLHPNLF